MASHDFLDDDQTDPGSLSTWFGGKEWLQYAPGIGRGNARTVIDNGKNQPAMSIASACKNRNGSSRRAGVAGVEQQIHDGVLDQSGIAMDLGQSRLYFGKQANDVQRAKAPRRPGR